MKTLAIHARLVLLAAVLAACSESATAPEPDPPEQPPPTTPPAPVRVSRVAGRTDALAWSAARGRLYAVVRPSEASENTVLTEVDPVTALVTRTLSGLPLTGAAADVSADGKYLYVSGRDGIHRIDLDRFGQDLFIPLEAGFTASDLAVLPGAPRTVAAALVDQRGTYRAGGVVVFDDAVARPKAHAAADGPTRIEAADQPGKVYGFHHLNGGTGLFELAVTAQGVEETATDRVLMGALGTDIRHEGGLLFSRFGHVADPARRALLGRLGLSWGAVAPDVARQRAFTVEQGSQAVRAVSLAIWQPLGEYRVPDVDGATSVLLRLGADWLAFTTAREIVIIPVSAVVK